MPTNSIPTLPQIPDERSRLWQMVLAAARELTADETERAVLQRTKLLDVGTQRVAVAIAGRELDFRVRLVPAPWA